MAIKPRKGGTTFSFTAMPPSGDGTSVSFRAYLNDIQDSYSGQWGEHMDMGRGDPKLMYSQYSRTISVSFKTAALGPGEDSIWLSALNSLTEMTKPVYASGIGFNGVLCQMVIGAIIDEIGVVQNVDISIDNETPWINNSPVVIGVSVSFRVLGKVKPDYKKGNQGGLGGKTYGAGASD